MTLAESNVHEDFEKWKKEHQPITEPGIYEGLSFAEYAAIPAVSRSYLCALAESPADAQVFAAGGGETTKALEFGIGSHCLTLEPEAFAEDFAIGPDVKLNTKAGKDEWELFASQHPGKTLVRGADGRDMLGMREQLFRHPMASQLLAAEGSTEVVCVWRDKATGILCKSRLDRMIRWHGELAIVDFKSTGDASRRGFPKSFGEYLYFLQEAFYGDGAEAVTGEQVPNFFFIAQEKKAPYKLNVFTFHSKYREAGRKLYRDLLEVHAACTGRNRWPAMDGMNYVADVIEADVPAFAMREAK